MAKIVFASLLFGFILFCFFFIQTLKRPRHVENVVNIQTNTIDTSKMRISSFEKIAGSKICVASCTLSQNFQGASSFSYEKETHSINNYLFYDPATSNSNWLVSENVLFLDKTDFPQNSDPNKIKPIVASIYEFVDSDSTSDQSLSESDSKVIAISNPEGTKFTRLLKGVSEINSTMYTPDEKIHIFYTMNNKLYIVVVNTKTHQIVRNNPVKPFSFK